MIDDYWHGKALLQIKFPEFWRRACETENRFYRYVFDEARRHIELLGGNESDLAGDRCGEYWHRHCDFCHKGITLTAEAICYCTKDGTDWVCPECYDDLEPKYDWRVTDGIQDIPESFVRLELAIANK